MNEKPLERLNYFNGQRLQAADFKLEQEYHMRVRRWLNRSLYTPGIAAGLDVYKIEGKPKVKVMPGLAIDHLGREIILLDEQEVVVSGEAGSNGNGACKGPYLTIRYQEEVIAQQDLSCAIGSDAMNRVPWGGPARVLAEPVLDLNAELPHESSGKIALACLTLAKGCASVETVDTGVRRYVGEGSVSRVRQYALEGTRDIDADNPGVVAFHVRGRQPTTVTLYVRAEKFPSLHYSEMGRHTHAVNLNVNTLNIPAHSHDMPKSTTEAGTPHTHTTSSITANADSSVWDGVLGVVAAAAVGNPPGMAAAALAKGALFLADAFDAGTGMNLTLSPRPFRDKDGDNLIARVNMSVSLNTENQHTHGIPASTQPFPKDGSNQSFPLSGSATAAPAGVSDAAYSARSGAPLTYVDALQVAVDGVPVTDAVLAQIRNNRPPTENWNQLGNGTASHPLAATARNGGSGAIRLDFLPGVVFDEGEHRIEFSVTGNGNGGRIHFNLYVE